jgi:uncharacterized YigZ family protein
LKSIDYYYTIASNTSEILFKDKNSKFFGYAFLFEDEANLKSIIAQLKKKHPSAGHFCYAYQTNPLLKKFRANDDGEPNNSAGNPILGQIQSFNLTNVLVVVVRYFGGTKLGVSGLIYAYRNTAKLVLEQAEIVEKTINIRFEISFDYAFTNKIMRIIKENEIEIEAQNSTIKSNFILFVRQNNVEKVFGIFKDFHEVSLKIL